MTILGALALQQGSQTLQGLLSVHNAGGVVGGVDDDSLRVLGDQSLDGVQLDLESLSVGGNHHELGTVGGDKGTILGEEGSDSHDLAVGVNRQSLDDGDQSGSSTAGEEQLAGLDIQTETGGQIVSNSLTGRLKAGSHGVAVQLDRVNIIHDVHDGLVDLLGGGDAGVTEGVIIDLVSAQLGSLLQTVSKQCANDGRGRAQIVIFLIDHNTCSSFSHILNIL